LGAICRTIRAGKKHDLRDARYHLEGIRRTHRWRNVRRNWLREAVGTLQNDPIPLYARAQVYLYQLSIWFGQGKMRGPCDDKHIILWTVEHSQVLECATSRADASSKVSCVVRVVI
jgi:hypothetical protein